MNTEQTLIQETNKWLNKIEPIAEKLDCFDTKGEQMLQNIKAYIADAKHFLDKKDYVRAFECCIWSWAILETCIDLGVFVIEETK